MDCRKPLILALGLLISVGGCTYPVAELRIPGPTEGGKSAEEGAHKASTYVAFGDMRAAAAFAAENTPAQKKQFREEAVLAYAKAIEVDPRYLPAYASLARLQQAAEDHAGALAVYEQALKINDRDPALWYEMGMCQCRLKNWSPAVANLRKACELDPKNRQYGKTLGLAMARTGQYQESFIVLSRYCGEVNAHIDLARMLRHLKQPYLARQHVMAALWVDPSHQAGRALLTELENAGPHEVQTASYNTSGSATGSEGNPGASAMRGRPIPVPPLPTISIRSKE